MPKLSAEIDADFIARNIGSHREFNHSNDVGHHAGYILAAARSRGLITQSVTRTHHYFFDQQRRPVGALRDMVTSLVASSAITACNSKRISKQLWAYQDVPSPSGKTFRHNERTAAAEYLASANLPMVVKPNVGSAGNAVSTGVATLNDFDAAWELAKAATSKGGLILMEEHVRGTDVRALVVGDCVAAAACRLPAFVVGDGENTVEALVDRKRVLRGDHAYLARMTLRVETSWLAHQGHDLRSVPRLGEVVILNGTVNLHQGGESLDVTHVLSPDLKDLAVRAAKAIPGLGVAGVDLIVKDLDTVEGAVVIEANRLFTIGPVLVF